MLGCHIEGGLAPKLLVQDVVGVRVVADVSSGFSGQDLLEDSYFIAFGNCIEKHDVERLVDLGAKFKDPVLRPGHACGLGNSAGGQAVEFQAHGH